MWRYLSNGGRVARLLLQNARDIPAVVMGTNQI